MTRTETAPPAGRISGRAGTGAADGRSTRPILRDARPNVKCLVDQADAAEARALANAAWHRERAGRYLAWCDLTWCAAQYAHHLAEADFQEALAARHRQIAAALGEVRHG